MYCTIEINCQFVYIKKVLLNFEQQNIVNTDVPDMDICKKIVIVGGCGHVGIPLGLALASRDFDITLVDKNEKCVAMINDGVLPFK